MDIDLARRVGRFAPSWLRYMVTLSEAVRTGNTWVVASGDDIALWDTDAGAVLPVWPSEQLAGDASSDETQAAPVSITEIRDRLLPFLAESDANISLFPNFDDDMLIEPAAVTEDLTSMVAEHLDVVAQLTEPPTEAVYDEWALLEAPSVEDEHPTGRSPVETGPILTGDRLADALSTAAAIGVLWLLDDPAEEAVVGMVLDDQPALALWTSQAEAADYAERVGSLVTPRSVGVDALACDWMLMAYGAGWRVALSPDAERAAFLEPSRFALNLAEACSTK